MGLMGESVIRGGSIARFSVSSYIIGLLCLMTRVSRLEVTGRLRTRARATGISFTSSDVNQGLFSSSHLIRTRRFACLCWTFWTAFINMSTVMFPFIRATTVTVENGENEKSRSIAVTFLSYLGIFSGIIITVHAPQPFVLLVELAHPTAFFLIPRQSSPSQVFRRVYPFQQSSFHCTTISRAQPTSMHTRQAVRKVQFL